MRKLTPLVAASSFATLLATIPQTGFALGLGKLSVDSDLGEPLQLVIELDSVSAAEAETLDVSLGSRADFTRANIEYPALGDQLDFELVDVGGGRYLVEITTKDPIQEAYIHFLVNATWSGGTAVREYTALLDPPLYSGNTTTTVNLANDTSSTTNETSTSSEQSQSTASSSQSTRGVGAGDSITVSRGDTLSQIVSGISKPADVNYYQALEAVYRKNPSAFIDSNMNLLRSGATLEVPSFEEMSAVTRSESIASFTEQLDRFNEYKGLVAQQQEEDSSESLDELIDDSETAAEEAQEEEEVAALLSEEDSIEDLLEEAELEAADLQVELDSATELTEPSLTVGQDDGTDALAETDDNAAQIEALKAQLQQLEETSLADSEESASVIEGAEELESGTERLSTLIEVEDTNLANLQNNLNGDGSGQDLADPESGEASDTLSEDLQQNLESLQTEVASLDDNAIDASEEAADDILASLDQGVDTVTEGAADILGIDSNDTEAEASVEEQVAIEAEENVDPVEDEDEEVAAVAAVPESDTSGAEDSGTETAEANVDDSGNIIESTVRQVSNNSLIDSAKGILSSLPEHAAKIGVGLLALLGGLFFWQRRRTQREYDASMLDIETEEVSLNSEASVQRMSDASGIDLASANDSALELTIGGGMSYLSEQGITGVNEEENEVIKAGAVDPLAEADVYLAYDRDEQAIQVLKEAFDESPERGELAEKLLEIYHKQDDRRAYDELAADLQSKLDATENLNWERVVSMGREVSPDNAMYSGDGAPQSSAASPSGDSELNLDDDDDDLLSGAAAPLAGAAAAASAVGAGLAAKAGGLDANSGSLDMMSLGSDTPETAVDELEMSDLDIDLSPESPDAVSPLDAPTLSQIINDNLEGKIESDDASGEASLSSSTLDLSLGNEEDSTLKRIEEASKIASTDDSDKEDPETGGLSGFSGLDQQSVLGAISDSQMSQLEPYHESETALELAKAYMELGEQEIAKGFIEEVLNEGSEKQKGKARTLIKELTG